MASLAKCLEKSKLSKAEQRDILKAAQTYRDEGFGAVEANTGAAQDVINDLNEERDSILRQAVKGGFVLPPAGIPEYSPEAALSPEDRKLLAKSRLMAKHPTDITVLLTEDIHFDPDRFQFKRMVGKKGVGAKFKHLTKFDPTKGGIITVWKDPKDNKTYVINGHHRLELAHRTNYPTMLVQYLNAKTDEEARTAGAVMNIAGNNGEPEDAALIFRQIKATPQELESEYGLSLSEPIARKGLALSKLADGIFDLVYKGKLKQNWGVVIGEKLPDHAAQLELMKFIRKKERAGHNITQGMLEQTINVIAGTEKVQEETLSLFGKEAFERPLLLESAELMDYALRQLSTDKRLFKAVTQSDHVKRLTSAGNVLELKNNKEIANNAAIIREVLVKLANLSGEVSDLRNKFAKELYSAKGKARTKVKKLFLEAVRAVVPSIISGQSAVVAESLGQYTPAQSATAALGSERLRTDDWTPTTPQQRQAARAIWERKDVDEFDRIQSYPSRAERKAWGSGFKYEYRTEGPIDVDRFADIMVGATPAVSGKWIFTRQPLSMYQAIELGVTAENKEALGAAMIQYYRAVHSQTAPIELMQKVKPGKFPPHEDNRDNWLGVVVHKSTKPDALPWQATYFYWRWFTGDTQHTTEEDAVGDYMMGGYTIPQPGLLDGAVKAQQERGLSFMEKKGKWKAGQMDIFPAPAKRDLLTPSEPSKAEKVAIQRAEGQKAKQPQSWFELGRLVNTTYPPDQGSTLKPTREGLKAVASRLGISPRDAGLALDVFNDVDPQAVLKRIKKPLPKVKLAKPKAVIPEGKIKGGTTGKQASIFGTQKGETQDMFSESKIEYGEDPPPVKGGIYVMEALPQEQFSFLEFGKVRYPSPKAKATLKRLPGASRIEMQTTGNIKGDRMVASTDAEVASLVSFIRKSAQEQSYAIATDVNGMILQVHKYGKGLRYSASISPMELLGPALGIRDIKHLHFVHNHPTGETTGSAEDLDLHKQFDLVLKTKNIDFNSIVIGGTEYKNLVTGKGGKIPGMVKRITIPVKERMIRKPVSKSVPKMNNENDLRDYLEDQGLTDTSGALLVDRHYRPLAFLPFIKGRSFRQTTTDILRYAHEVQAGTLAFNLGPDATEAMQEYTYAVGKEGFFDITILEILKKGVSVGFQVGLPKQHVGQMTDQGIRKITQTTKFAFPHDQHAYSILSKSAKERKNILGALYQVLKEHNVPLERIQASLVPIVTVPETGASSLEQHMSLHPELREPIESTTFQGLTAAVQIATHAKPQDLQRAYFHTAVHSLVQWGYLGPKQMDQLKRYYGDTTLAEGWNEEKFADEYYDYRQDPNKVIPKAPGFLQKIWRKINRFFKRLKNSLKGRGFFRPEDIFGQMQVGALHRPVLGSNQPVTRTAFTMGGERGMARAFRYSYKMPGHRPMESELAKAEDMEGEGASETSIWQETGWMRGPDHYWRFEIDDSGAKLHEIATAHLGPVLELADGHLLEPVSAIALLGNKGVSLTKTLDHPKLYKYYPQLKNVTVRASSWTKGGSYDEETKTILINDEVTDPDRLMSVLLHEAQHAIQQIEGFSVGSSPEAEYNTIEYLEERDAYKKEIDRQHKEGKISGLQGGDLLDAWEEDQGAFARYERVYGEIEARDVQDRRFWPDVNRRNIPPDRQAIEPEHWIMREGDGTAFSIERNPEDQAPLADDLKDDGLIILKNIVDNPTQAVQDMITEGKDSRIFHHLRYLQGKQQADVEVFLQERNVPGLLAGIRNMEGVLSKTKEGRNIYEALRMFKEMTVRKFKDWHGQYDELVEGFTDEQKRTILNILDTTEEITGDTQMERAAAQLRTLMTGVRQYLIDHGHHVGYIEGYLPHIFQGGFWVSYKGGKGQSEKVDSMGDALKLADKLGKQGEKGIRIMQDTFIPPDDATMLSKGSYWRLAQAIRDMVNEPMIDVFGEPLDNTDIHRMLSGDKVARALPRKRFFGNMRQRLVNNPNYIKDLDEIMHLYLYGASRKVSQDILLRTVQGNLDAMPPGDADLKKWIQTHAVPQALAHPTKFEKSIAALLHKGRRLPFMKNKFRLKAGASPQDVRRFMHNINLPQYVLDLGLSASSAIANGSQFFMNAYPIVGEKSAALGYARGAKTFVNVDLLKEVSDQGITQSVSSVTGEIILDKKTIKEFIRKISILGEGAKTRSVGDALKGFMEATLMPFSMVELMNRFGAYWAGKDYAWKEVKGGRSAVDIVTKSGIVPDVASLFDMARDYDARMADTKIQRNASWKKKTARLQEEFAQRFGYELNEKTNFRVGRENLPQLLAWGPVRFLSPYKSFLTNQIKYTMSTYGDLFTERRDVIRALRFTGMTFLLSGVAGNPVFYAMFLAVALLLKRLFGVDLKKEALRSHEILGVEVPPLYRGLFGALGIDISGSVAVQLPRLNRPIEFLGRYGEFLYLNVERLIRKEMGYGTIRQERQLKRLIWPAMALRIKDGLDIYEKGYYVTPQTRTPIMLREEPWVAAVKKAVGMMPRGVSELFEMERMTQRQTSRFRSVSQDLNERLATAINENDIDAQWDVITVASKRMVKAVEKLGKARTDDEFFESLSTVLFYSQWFEENKGLMRSLERQYIPRNISKALRLPNYLKPGVLKELVR